MTAPTPPPLPPDDAPDRLHELLADEATQGLTAVEKDELDRLLSADRDDLALAAAAADRAFGLRSTPLPATLQARLDQAAAAFRPAEPAEPAKPAPKPSPRRALWARSGWAVAAGIGLVFAGNLAVGPKAPHPPAPAEMLADLKTDPATRAYHAAGAGAVKAGLVHWHPGRHEGVLEVDGLPPNDPSREQYQVWVHDAGRVDPEPVDAGLFDVPPSAAAPVLVAVRPKLRVKDAKAFIVTREPAGGVVLSQKPRLVVLTPKGH